MTKVATKRTRTAVCIHEMQKDGRKTYIRTTNEKIESEEAKGRDPELP
jgi:hypothetical protein